MTMPPTAPPAAAAARPKPSVAGTVAALLVGFLALIVAVPAALVGAGLLLLDTARVEGFLTTSPVPVRTDGAAVVSPLFSVEGDDVTGIPLLADLLTFRVAVEGADPKAPVFIGIGPADEVAETLADTDHAVVRRVANGSVRLREVKGGSARLPAAPDSSDFPVEWVASASGPGRQQLDWTATPGSWTVVVANADGTGPVDVVTEVGWAGPPLVPAGWASLAVGLLLGLVGLVLLAVGVVRLVRSV